MENQNLKLFKDTVRNLFHYLYGEATYNTGQKELLIRTYKLEKSEEVKKEMVISLYRILLMECRDHHREQHAFAAIAIDKLMTTGI